MQNFGIYFWFRRKYIPVKVKKRKNYYITGHWQCEKFFSGVRNELINDFSPREEVLKLNENIISKNKDLYNHILESESVCLAIRRGDYITNPKNAKRFYLCGNDYFDRAIEKMRSIHPNATFFVFTDELEWAKKNIRITDNPVYYEPVNTPKWEKIRLMSACKHFILSNSSFCWWAEYLSVHENKTTIAPSKWYLCDDKPDIYRDYWILIDV